MPQSSYEEVAVGMNCENMRLAGGSCSMEQKDWFINNGWSWQVMEDPHVPKPFAPSHIVHIQGTQPNALHCVAMDADGNVFDPLDQKCKSLDHPGYKHVRYVVGLWRICHD